MSVEAAKAFVAQVVAGMPDGIFRWSSVLGGLAERLEGRRWGTILEIGTYRGMSAVVLARFAEAVITIDTEAQPEVAKVLELGGCADRVSPIIVPNNAAKTLLIKNLHFDMAFIDGGHSYVQVLGDYASTKRCGELLFHDYPDSGSGMRGVGQLFDELPVSETEPCEPFAWWRAAK